MEMYNHDFNWDATAFFEKLTKANKLAASYNFAFDRVSSLEGFHSLLSTALSTLALVAVSDTSSGNIDLNNTPRTRRVKTIYMFMRHKVDDMIERQRCLEIMNEIVRQFFSVVIRERTRLRERNIYIDEQVSFSELDKYFYTGGACAYFKLAVNKFTDLSFNSDEWLQQLEI